MLCLPGETHVDNYYDFIGLQRQDEEEEEED